MRASVSGRVVDASACGYYWLLEAFLPPIAVDGVPVQCFGEGGVYANKTLEATTTNAWDAHWFATKEEAESFLDKVPAAEGREWRATEHGFYGG